MIEELYNYAWARYDAIENEFLKLWVEGVVWLAFTAIIFGIGGLLVMVAPLIPEIVYGIALLLLVVIFGPVVFALMVQEHP